MAAFIPSRSQRVTIHTRNSPNGPQAVAPDNSTGLTIEGNYVQTESGALQIELGGANPNSYSQLMVTGSATLAGKLVFKCINGFAPKKSDQFEFLKVNGAVSKMFSATEVRNLAPGFQFDVVTKGQNISMVALNDGVFATPLQGGFQASPVTKNGITYLPYALRLDRPCQLFLPSGAPIRNGDQLVQVLAESLGTRRTLPGRNSLKCGRLK